MIEIKDAIEDLVNMCIDSHNLILKGNFPATVADEVHNHLKQCLAVIEACTVKPSLDEDEFSIEDHEKFNKLYRDYKEKEEDDC